MNALCRVFCSFKIKNNYFNQKKAVSLLSLVFLSSNFVAMPLNCTFFHFTANFHQTRQTGSSRHWWVSYENIWKSPEYFCRYASSFWRYILLSHQPHSRLSSRGEELGTSRHIRWCLRKLYSVVNLSILDNGLSSLSWPFFVPPRREWLRFWSTSARSYRFICSSTYVRRHTIVTLTYCWCSTYRILLLSQGWPHINIQRIYNCSVKCELS